MITLPLNTARLRLTELNHNFAQEILNSNTENVLNTSFKMSIKDFGNFLELKTNKIYEIAKKITKDLATRVIEIEKGEGELIQLPVLSKIEYKKGIIELS